jgi:hypothetical protein
VVDHSTPGTAQAEVAILLAVVVAANPVEMVVAEWVPAIPVAVAAVVAIRLVERMVEAEVSTLVVAEE